MKLEEIQAPQILGITEQQLDILKTIYKINTKNKKATPQEIENTFYKDYNGKIQKSNLFRQLKILLDKKLINRDSEADYTINLKGIKTNLELRRKQFQQTLDNYSKLSNEIEEYFRRVSLDNTKPYVKYLEYTPFFEQVSNSIKDSKAYYSTGKFPNIFYPRPLLKGISRGSFGDKLFDKCFDENIEVRYLTNLDLDNPYNHALQVYGDAEKAYLETEYILNRLSEFVHRYDNLKIHYLKEPYGLDILIPEKSDQTESYMFIRDDRMNILGGIYIKSKETTRRAKETFLKICESATRIKGKSGEKIIRQLKKDLIKYEGAKNGG